HLQDALGGGLVAVPVRRQQLADRAVGVHPAAPAAAAQLACRAGAGDALHQMDMGVDDLHARSPLVWGWQPLTIRHSRSIIDIEEECRRPQHRWFHPWVKEVTASWASCRRLLLFY